MFGPSGATAAAIQSSHRFSLVGDGGLPPIHHHLHQHQAQQQVLGGLGSSTAAAAAAAAAAGGLMSSFPGSTPPFTLPPSAIHQFATLPNTELARQLLSAELATRFVHERMLLAPPGATGGSSTAATGSQLSSISGQRHQLQAPRQQTSTSSGTETAAAATAALLHQRFVSAAAAAAMSAAAAAAAGIGPGSVPCSVSGSTGVGPGPLIPAAAGGNVVPGGSFPPGLHQLLQLSSAAAAAAAAAANNGIAVDSCNTSGFTDAAMAAAVNIPGAFQPKTCASGGSVMDINSRSPVLPPGVATPLGSVSSGGSRYIAKKPGRWCAAHVRTAWAIHIRQQQEKRVQSVGLASANVGRNKPLSIVADQPAAGPSALGLPPYPVGPPPPQLPPSTAINCDSMLSDKLPPSDIRNMLSMLTPLGAEAAFSLLAGSSPYCSPDVARSINKAFASLGNMSAAASVLGTDRNNVLSNNSSEELKLSISKHLQTEAVQENRKRKTDHYKAIDDDDRRNSSLSPQARKLSESAFCLTDSHVDGKTNSPNYQNHQLHSSYRNGAKRPYRSRSRSPIDYSGESRSTAATTAQDSSYHKRRGSSSIQIHSSEQVRDVADSELQSVGPPASAASTAAHSPAAAAAVDAGYHVTRRRNDRSDPLRDGYSCSNVADDSSTPHSPPSTATEPLADGPAGARDFTNRLWNPFFRTELAGSVASTMSAVKLENRSSNSLPLQTRDSISAAAAADVENSQLSASPADETAVKLVEGARRQMQKIEVQFDQSAGELDIDVSDDGRRSDLSPNSVVDVGQ